LILFKVTNKVNSNSSNSIAAMPGATMRIYNGEPVDGRVAESVKIGDPLTLVNFFVNSL